MKKIGMITMILVIMVVWAYETTSKEVQNRFFKFPIGDKWIDSMVSDEAYLYFATGNRVLKCNKSDLSIVNFYELPIESHKVCLISDYLYVSGISEIIKLNKSDLSYVAGITAPTFDPELISDENFIYCSFRDWETGETKILKYDFDLTLIDTLVLSLPYDPSRMKYYDGFLYVLLQSLGLYITKVDVSTFTEVAQVDFSAEWAWSFDMTGIGTNIYLLASKSTYESAVLKITTDLVEIGNTPLTTDSLFCISNDGINIFYTQGIYETNVNLREIDTDLKLIKETPIDKNFIEFLLDDDYFYFSASSEISGIPEWYKYTKSDLTKVATGQGILDEEIESKVTLPCDGTFIYLATNQRLHKINIDTFEDTVVSEFFNELSIVGPRRVAVDDKYLYLTTTSPSATEGYIYRFDKNNFELIDNIVLPEAAPSEIAIGPDYLYVAGNGFWAEKPAKIWKIRKSDFTLIQTFDTGDIDYSETMDLILGGDYLFLAFRSVAKNWERSSVWKIDPETLTKISQVDGNHRAMSALKQDEKYIYYNIRDWTYKINKDTMVKEEFGNSSPDPYWLAVSDNHIYVGDDEKSQIKIHKYDKGTFELREPIIIPGVSQSAEITWSGFCLLNNQFLFYTYGWPARTLVETNLEIEIPEINKALSLDGEEDYVELLKSVPDMTELTIETWVYHTGGGTIFMDATTHGGNDFVFIINSSGIGIRADKSGASLNYESQLAIEDLTLGNAWHHVVWTMTSSESKIYVDGILKTIKSEPGSNVGYHSVNPSIGRWWDEGSSRWYFKGFIDEFRIWNIARTQEEIQADMNQPLENPQSMPNLVGYWNFDDGTAKDSSPNGNHGTLWWDAKIVPIYGTWPPPLRGDVSGDKTVSAYDAALILQYVVGLIDEFPADSMGSPSTIEPNNYEISLPQLETTADGKIQVPIVINDTTGLLAGGITVKYASTVLRATDVLCGGILSQSYWRKNTDLDDEVRFAFASAKGATGSGRMLVIEFEVLPNTEGKTSPLILENVNLSNSLTITKINGLVQVIPSTFALLQNYPNPFNPDTWLPFKLAQDSPVTIQIYNQKGQLVRSISLGDKPAGVYTTKSKAAYWDGRDSLGEKVSSGVYFYTLQAGEFRATRKMLIIK